MENPIRMDDLGVSLFLETPIYFEPFIAAPNLTPFITGDGYDGPPSVALARGQHLSLASY